MLSVVIPAYNSLDPLKQKLASVQQQTFADIEIVLEDDCSPTDEIQAIRLTSLYSMVDLFFVRKILDCCKFYNMKEMGLRLTLCMLTEKENIIMT